MRGNTKIKKAIIATLMTIVIAIACFITVYAVSQYLWQQTQQGHQNVVKPVNGTAYEFNLTKGYVGVASYEFVNPSPVLEIATKKANLTLQISCSNNNNLCGNYSNLELMLYYHSDHSYCLGTLNLLSSNILNYTLSGIGTYQFDYTILYTPSVEANNTIMLCVNVINESP